MVKEKIKKDKKEDEDWVLKLYVSGNTVNSVKALQNLKSICEEMMPGKYRIEVIDLSVNPQLAVTDQILAIPTVVRQLPTPIRKLIGDLSNKEKVLVGLNINKNPLV